MRGERKDMNLEIFNGFAGVLRATWVSVVNSKTWTARICVSAFVVLCLLLLAM